MNTQDYLSAFYADYDEEGRLLTRYGHVEFATTMRYIHRYLIDGARILEIGAGTGRYSHALAREGYAVDAVELIGSNIDQFRAHTQPGENITIRQGNACNLSFLADNIYDVTLLLGPMYHLFTQEEKLAALREAIRVTKPGGVIFVAYCMADPSVLCYGFVRGKIDEIVEKNMVDPVTFKAFSNPWDIFELHRTEDIADLRGRFDVTSLHLIAADGYANHMRDILAEMPEERYQLFLRYHFATCERTDMLGYSHHTLDIFQKNRV